MKSRIGPLQSLTIAIALTFTLSAAEAQPPGLPGTTITVNSLSDGNVIILPGDPQPCTLRYAIQAANTNQAVGGCPAGQDSRIVSANPVQVNFIDRIVFAVGTGTPRIQLRSALPVITEELTIDGATGDATRIEISGNQIFNPFAPSHGLQVTGMFATFKSLVINGFTGHGILLTHVDGNGIPVITPDRPDRPSPDPNFPPGGPCGPNAFPADPSQCPPPGGDPNGSGSSGSSGGGGGSTVLNCLIGTNAAGTQAVPNGTGPAEAAGIALLSPGNVIGGTAAGSRNVISGNRGHGVLIDKANNTVVGNLIGTGLSTSVPLPNLLDGIRVGGGRFSQASGEIRENTIAHNGGDGVDGGYNRISILSNRIHSNGRLGIERGEVGVTANDTTGTRVQPPNFPVLTGRRMTIFGGLVLSGEIEQHFSDPVTLQFFHSTTCDPSGHGEGASLIGTKVVSPGTFSHTINTLVPIGFITATATTAHGTSEFSGCLQN